MEFKICLENPNNLFKKDSSLSLGWFEITYKEIDFCIFKKGYCMVFLNLTTLVEILKISGLSKTNTHQWVGEDNGFVLNLSKKKGNLEFASQEVLFNVDFEKFKSCVLEYSKKFVKDCVLKNKLIEFESAYIDLCSALKDG